MQPAKPGYVPPPRSVLEWLGLVGMLLLIFVIVAIPGGFVGSVIAVVTKASEAEQTAYMIGSVAVLFLAGAVKVVRDDIRDHAAKHRPVEPRKPLHGGWSPQFGSAAYYLKEMNDRQNRGDL